MYDTMILYKCVLIDGLIDFRLSECFSDAKHSCFMVTVCWEMSTTIALQERKILCFNVYLYWKCSWMILLQFCRLFLIQCFADCNPGLAFSILGSRIKKFLVLGSHFGISLTDWSLFSIPVVLGGSAAQWLGRWLVIERSRVRLPPSPLPSNNSGQVVQCSHPCASVTKQYNLVPAKGRDALQLGR